jgi:heme-degrading monooxygenase HmoA
LHTIHRQSTQCVVKNVSSVEHATTETQRRAHLLHPRKALTATMITRIQSKGCEDSSVIRTQEQQLGQSCEGTRVSLLAARRLELQTVALSGAGATQRYQPKRNRVRKRTSTNIKRRLISHSLPISYPQSSAFPRYRKLCSSTMNASLAPLLLWCFVCAGAFTAAPALRSWQGLEIIRSPSFSLAASTVVDQDLETATTTTNDDGGLAKRDRYVATNRFAVRKDQQAKFEKRWATRKSRLATLPGFRYFHLMRRVRLNDKTTHSYEYDGGDTEEQAQENYVSFTIWNKKSDFSAWRKGGKSVDADVDSCA